MSECKVLVSFTTENNLPTLLAENQDSKSFLFSETCWCTAEKKKKKKKKKKQKN